MKTLKTLAAGVIAIALTACTATSQPSFESQLHSATNTYSDFEQAEVALRHVPAKSLDDRITKQTEITKVTLLKGDSQMFSKESEVLEKLLVQKPLHLRTDVAMTLVHLSPIRRDDRLKKQVVTNRIHQVVTKRCSPEAIKSIRGDNAVAERELAMACAKLVAGNLEAGYRHLLQSLTLNPNPELQSLIVRSDSISEAIVRITDAQIAKDSIQLLN